MRSAPDAISRFFDDESACLTASPSVWIKMSHSYYVFMARNLHMQKWPIQTSGIVRLLKVRERGKSATI
jgi:hypothetical protein